MKILMITPYVTIDGMKEFEKNRTGFGYMVMDIARAVGQLEKVSVFATDSCGTGFEQGGVVFLNRSVWTYILNIWRGLSPRIVLRLLRQYRMRPGTLLRLFYYWLCTGSLCRLLREEDYDLVHIHGCSFGTEVWMKVCRRCGKGFLVTLHGLNSFSDTVRLEPAGNKYERDFLRRVINGEIPITVISSGMKRIIEQAYGIKNCKNITVVCNSFSFSDMDLMGGVDIRTEYGIPVDAKILLCVGNMGRRKNQGQLVMSFDLIPEIISNNWWIMFIGANQDNTYNIDDFSSQIALQHHIVVCGYVDKTLMPSYYIQADAVALMSLSEGFGLSLIEGMHFGLPCMSFTDIDAFDDIFNNDAMIGVEGHSDEDVARGLVQLFATAWDKNKIKEYSKKFECQPMAKHYIDVYQRTI